MTLLSDEAQVCLDAYLKDVAAAMTDGGCDRSEIEAAIEGLREQVHDLATNGGRGSASMDQVQRALARLDPPNSYAAPTPAADTGRATTDTGRTQKVLGKISVAASLGGAAIALSFQVIPQPTEAFGAIVFCLGQLVGLAAGATAWRNLWGRFGALCSGLLFCFFLLAAALQ